MTATTTESAAPGLMSHARSMPEPADSTAGERIVRPEDVAHQVGRLRVLDVAAGGGRGGPPPPASAAGSIATASACSATAELHQDRGRRRTAPASRRGALAAGELAADRVDAAPTAPARDSMPGSPVSASLEPPAARGVLRRQRGRGDERAGGERRRREGTTRTLMRTSPRARGHAGTGHCPAPPAAPPSTRTSHAWRAAAPAHRRVYVRSPLAPATGVSPS